MSSSFKYATRAAGLAALLAVASCVVDAGPPPYYPGPGPEFCPRVYDPVCAERGRDRQTFSNACEARSEQYRIIYPGQCRPRSGPPITPPPGPGPITPPRPQPGGLSCTQVYDPVCARQGGHVRTFGNACEAGVANYEIISSGPC